MLTRSFRKLLPKIVGLSLLIFLSGYQPVWSVPPIKRSTVQADFSQTQLIKAVALSDTFSLPHPGYISTHFSSWHPGVDIASGLGMPIHPILKGKVIDVTSGFFGLGHFVTVKHESGYKSTYGHMGKIYVKLGDQVEKSAILGEVGLTGNTSGPHTHLEITHNGSYVDPETLLPTPPPLPLQ